MSVRTLLRPGKMVHIPFDRSFLFSKWIAKGSRLLFVLDVNVNPFAEVNYGTGKDVGAENIRDAGMPLAIQWLTTSHVRIRARATI